MNELTHVFLRIEEGHSSTDELLPLVYGELRNLAEIRLAEEKPGQTLQATALVHEAFLRLVDPEQIRHWNGRGHFFAAAAEAMRRILINSARDKQRLKHGGALRKVDLDLDQVEIAFETPAEELLALNEALEQLAIQNPACAELVKLRFFAGLRVQDAAQALGISASTADRHWAFARAWLYRTLRSDDTIF